MKKLTCFIFAALLSLSTTGTLEQPLRQAQGRPDVLLILADDLGYADLGVQGCAQFKIPHIDSIAQCSVRFWQGQVSKSVCLPSREEDPLSV